MSKKVKKIHNKSRKYASTFDRIYRKISDMLIDILLPTVIVLWYLFLFVQLISAIVAKNFDIFLNYGQISLTFFGFTLLGTFFEKKQLKNYKTKKEKEMIERLVRINLNFLLTSISFFAISASFSFCQTSLIFKLPSFYLKLL